MDVELMSSILGLFLLASRILPSAEIECASTINLKYGEMNEISCEYPLSFLSVRWYRRRDSTPIARIEGGSKSVTQGYDITVRGNLQVNHVDVSHAGIYNISVLDVDGFDDTEAINAYVTAGLTEKPILERCDSTHLALCSGISEPAKSTTLICSAHNTLPAVDFKWYHLMNTQNRTLNSSSSQYIRNETSMLFSSYSTLSYEPNSFTLNIFTCKAIGFAASSDALASSVLVEGALPPRKTVQIIRPADINTIVKLKCSASNPLLASWRAVYPNGTVKIFRDIYPGSTGGNCSSRNRCHVDHMATLTVYDVQKRDEAAYECLYFDGNDSGKTVFQLNVIVLPDPYRIVVQGCNDTLHCKLDVVTLQGSFKVSVKGARPSADLSCEVAGESKAKISVFNTESNIVEQGEMGTYDTEVIVDYVIQECVERVHVVCQIPPNTVHENISDLNIVLITEATGCGTSNTGLVVGLVVGILILVVAVSIVTYVILRKERSKDTNQHPKTKTETELYQLEAQHEEEQPLLNGNFETFFESFCQNVKDAKEVPAKEFRSLMAHFKDCKPDEPSVSLVNHMAKTNQPEEVLHIVLRYLARETVQSQDTAQIFCKLVEDLTGNNKLSVENFTKIFESLINKSKITLSDFDSAKMRLLQSNTLNYNSKLQILTGDEELAKKPYPNILQFIYDLYKTNQYNDNTLLILLQHTFRKYVIITKDEAKTNKEDDSEIKEEDPEIITKDEARTVKEDYKEIKEDPEIITKDEAKTNKEDDSEIKEEDPEELDEAENEDENLIEKRDITGVYIKGILCSVLDDTVTLEVCGQLLEFGLDCEKSNILKYKKAYADSFQKETNKDEIFWIRFIAYLWDMNVIKEEIMSSFILKIVETFLMLREDVKKAIGDLISKSRRKECLRAIKFKDEDIKKKKKEKSKAENKMQETK